MIHWAPRRPSAASLGDLVSRPARHGHQGKPMPPVAGTSGTAVDRLRAAGTEVCGGSALSAVIGSCLGATARSILIKRYPTQGCGSRPTSNCRRLLARSTG